MKIQARLWALAAVVGFALGTYAQPTDLILNTFDTAAEASDWGRWWGSAGQLYEHDATVDADGNASSGSLKATINFDFAAYGGDNQFAVLRQFPVQDASVYTNLVFDLRWDPSSPIRPNGTDHGLLDPGFRSAGFGQTWLPSRVIPTHGNWVRFEIPINPTLPNLDTASGVVLKMWAGNASGALTGTATFWLDNVKLVAITNAAPPPPPTLSITKAHSGLNIVASHPTEQYQRQSIRTVSTALGWFDQFDPVTFAIDIAKFPDGGHSGFQAHMFLAPANSLPFGAGDSTVDWNAPHIIFWQIANNADGTAYTRFMVKTNQPGGNSQLWASGTLAIIGSTTPLGRWTVAIDSGSTVTITTPSGAVTNFAIPAETAAFFRDDAAGNPLYAWFGVQPNNPANIGQEAIFSRIQITRELDGIDDQFTGPSLDTSKWVVSAYNAAGVAAVPPNAIGWVKWTLPDVGFRLQENSDLAAGLWNLSVLAPVQIIDHKRVLVTPTDPPPPNLFFRLEKPAAP